MPTHKKGHDKDKYYHLAKDQGFRSRAAFKLIQINKRFDFLTKARVCVDLCAAPGGWCQVAAKYMPAGSIVLGIDLLPIRAIRNVKTVVSDITTAECRRIVSSELNGWKADVVLCDGAPNIGAAYDKDAYVQNELVLAALKTATDHLAEGGTFCTKVYRSKDYNALIWVFQQLFEDVQAIKPNSSRSQSSEIFIVCLKYTNPSRIDPKLLDPNHVFKEVSDPGLKTVDVLHKKYDKLNKRHRTGYDDDVGVLLRNYTSVTDFINCKEPVRMLTDINEFRFSDECDIYKESKYTTPEVVECLKDLRVLGKIDFKKLLKWRQHMRDMTGKDAVVAEDADADGTASASKSGVDRRAAKVETDESIQEEISKLRNTAMQAEKREKKKSRQAAAKERQRQALGMTNNAFGEADDMELFSMSANAQSLEYNGVNDVDLENEELEPTAWIQGDANDDNDDGKNVAPGSMIIAEDDLEEELEGAYMRYVKGRKKTAKERAEDLKEDSNGENPVTTKRARMAKTSGAILLSQNAEDAAILRKQGARAAAVHGDLQAYVKMLSGIKDKDAAGDNGKDDNDNDSDSDEDDDEYFDNRGSVGGANNDYDDDEDDKAEDGDDDDDDDSDGGASRKRQKMISSDRAPRQSRIDQWFSHPVFQESVISVDDVIKSKRSRNGENAGISKSVLDTIAQMPKTDKEIRKEKRKKELERQQRREVRNTNKVNAASSLDFDILPQSNSSSKVGGGGGGDDEDDDGVKLDDATRLKRDLIKRGLGKALRSNNKTSANEDGFEIAPAETGEQYPERMDDRSYDSDNEAYDNHDRATTLALGTLMLRKSRQKALVDASYNRFAWNDPKDLPSWFLDDESRHNKPQLPMPTALVDQIKSKFQLTGTKEIKKVAEARARKRKRAVAKLRSAKKQANMMAENSEMSEKQKIKAISRAMKTAKVDKSDKIYVVTKKTGAGSVGTRAGSGNGKLKFVDKLMKKEARAKRNAKKRGPKKKH